MSRDLTHEVDYRHLLNYKAYTGAENGVAQNKLITSTLIPAFESKTANFRRALIFMDVGIIGGGDSLGFDLQVGDGVTFAKHPDWTTETFNSSRHATAYVARLDLEKLSDKFIRGRVTAVTGSVVFGAAALLYDAQYLPTWINFNLLSQDV